MIGFFAVLFLLITSCHSSPINKALYRDAATQSLSSQNIRTLKPTNPPTHTLKPSLQPLPQKDDTVNTSNVRRLFGHTAVSEINARDDTEQKAQLASMTPDTGQPSKFNVIQPAINAALSDEANHLASRLTEKLNKVDYLSSPLRGTETRDRHALGMQYPAEGATSTSSYDHVIHQQHHSPHLQDVHAQASAAYSESSSPQYDHKTKESDVPNTETPHTQWGRRATKPNIPDSPTTERSHVSSYSKNYDAQPTTVKSSTTVKTRQKDVDTKGRKDLSAVAKEMIMKTAASGRVMYQKLKSALKGMASKQSSSSSSKLRENVRNGYTEEDVLKLVDDIMREIQMRADDMRDHAAMLEKNKRSDQNDIAGRERQTGVRERPLLYMKTKILVDPETVVDSVMTSTKKMLSSKTPQLPWNEVSKLMKEVQGRLSEVLIPAQ